MFSFAKGFSDCLSGFGLILQSGVKRYVIIPLVVNIVLFAGAVSALADQVDSWIQQLLPGWLSWLEWLILPLFYIAMLLVIFYTFTLVANLIASPFNSYLSSRVEANLTGVKPVDMSTDKLLKLAGRTIAAELRKIVYSIKWMIPLAILSFIPVVNVIAPFAWILFAIWFFALEYTDYPLANRGQLFDEVKKYNQKNRMRSLGLGSGIFLLTSIPVINFIAMPVAVAAATRLTVKVREGGNPQPVNGPVDG
ncbi:MAG TPA: sulfate transporter CysZ [Thiotrichales bacterium]|nr:sulfate transporter CysZ [Thiotrichales bacterium]